MNFSEKRTQNCTRNRIFIFILVEKNISISTGNKKNVNTQKIQRFCNILVTYLLYSSTYSKISPTFKVETIVLEHLKKPFCQFFDSMLTAVLVPEGELILLKFLSLLHCSMIVSAKKEPWIGRRNNMRKLWMDYILCVASVQFL